MDTVRTGVELHFVGDCLEVGVDDGEGGLVYLDCPFPRRLHVTHFASGSRAAQRSLKL
jgi:hypothetical protein